MTSSVRPERIGRVSVISRWMGAPGLHVEILAMPRIVAMLEQQLVPADVERAGERRLADEPLVDEDARAARAREDRHLRRRALEAILIEVRLPDLDGDVVRLRLPARLRQLDAVRAGRHLEHRRRLRLPSLARRRRRRAACTCSGMVVTEMRAGRLRKMRSRFSTMGRSTASLRRLGEIALEPDDRLRVVEQPLVAPARCCRARSGAA